MKRRKELNTIMDALFDEIKSASVEELPMLISSYIKAKRTLDIPPTTVVLFLAVQLFIVFKYF